MPGKLRMQCVGVLKYDHLYVSFTCRRNVTCNVCDYSAQLKVGYMTEHVVGYT